MGDSDAKRSKRTAQALESHGFRKPYQIVVDSSFARAMGRLENGIGKIQNMLRDDGKFYIPKCEYEKHREHMKERDMTGQCEIIKCIHSTENHDCLEALLGKGNKRRYLLATCDVETAKRFRDREDVPMLRVKSGQVIVDLKGMKRVRKAAGGGAPASKKELDSLKGLFGSDQE